MTRDTVVVHPGVQHSADLAASLDNVRRLVFLATRLQIGDGAGFPWNRPEVRKRLTRRLVPQLRDDRIRRFGVTHEVWERTLSRRLPPNFRASVASHMQDSFDVKVVHSLPEDTTTVIGTDTASLSLFTRLRLERPQITRILDISHPLDVVVQPLIRQDAATWGLCLDAYDDYHPGEALDQRPELSAADAVIVASAFSAAALTRVGYPVERVFVVPYGVRPTLVEPREFRGKLVLLALGAMSERKGMTLLLRAMTELEELGVPITLKLVGKPAGQYVLPEQLPANVEYLGSPPWGEVERLYREADVLVLPSMCEGFGRTLLEGLSFGCSVITTDSSGGPDILRAAPDAPLTILPVADRSRLSRVIVAHLDEPARWLRPQDARHAASVFSVEAYEGSLAAAIDEATQLH